MIFLLCETKQYFTKPRPVKNIGLVFWKLISQWKRAEMILLPENKQSLHVKSLKSFVKERYLKNLDV